MSIDYAEAIRSAIDRRDPAGASELARKWLIDDPDSAIAHSTAAELAVRGFDLDEAERLYEHAIALSPGAWESWNNLGNIKRYFGKLAEGNRCSLKAIELCPDRRSASRMHSNLVLRRNGDPLETMAQLCAAAHEFHRAQGFEPSALATPLGRTAGNKRIRVAYVSGAFNSAIVTSVLAAVLRHHDLSTFEVCLVNTNPKLNRKPEALNAAHLRWINVDALFAGDSIGIDVAVDIDGLSPSGSPWLFARRIAPVQISWFDWFCTTGNPEMDYFLGDAISTPPHFSGLFSERIISLAQFRFPFDGTRTRPAIKTRGLCAPRPFTFGVFNRVDKHHAGLLEYWAAILREAPGSELVFKASAFAAERLRARYAIEFDRMGVDSSRLLFVGASNYQAYLAEHNDVDLMLDTFPYTGGISTFESLSMGVPVLTVLGETTIGRQTAAIVSQIASLDLSSLIASDAAQYVHLAIEFATAQRPLPSKYDISKAFLRSKICDAAGFTKALERVYREVVKADTSLPTL
ncbi:MAG: hypothetical protein EAZ30_03320 [Betaproteobacteria bacterium]|nr:MAG: hypothetical protein EAZ30_03320 [Betaproteobacteria bacterium]